MYIRGCLIWHPLSFTKEYFIMNYLFEIRGTPSQRMSSILQFSGIVFLLLLWAGICATGWIGPRILPSPLAVIQTLPDLHFKDAMVRNLLYSCYLNIMGYSEAVAVCLPAGFLIGMFPLFNGTFSKPVDSIRYLPLTALTGLFMEWFGIENMMKIQFLAFGISVYLLPVVVQRVREVPVLYQQTAFTLGASKWQMFRTVFFPYVRSRIVLDIQVLVAISWTYIIVAEMMNNTGGIGGLLYGSARAGRTDKTFALLAVIILVGYVQDKIFLVLDMLINPHKYS
jgi:NitT/TauT family transport system permease protein